MYSYPMQQFFLYKIKNKNPSALLPSMIAVNIYFMILFSMRTSFLDSIEKGR
jgi:hypothetical protein